jgi:hypothetical protein
MQVQRLQDVVFELRGLGEKVTQLIEAVNTQVSIPAVPKPQSQSPHASGPVNRTVEDVRMLFPAEIDELLEYHQMEGYVKIKPKRFLENFADVAKQVKYVGGEYVSAGKDSHFKVPNRTDAMKPVQRNTRPATGFEDSEGIVWTKQQGEKGEYEKATLADNKDNPAFYALEDWVRENEKPFRDGFFYWYFDRGAEAIGRKRPQQQEKGRRQNSKNG